MMRVASLYLPEFAIERLRRADARASQDATPPDPERRDAAPAHVTVTRAGGWRPGARWARADPDATAAARDAAGAVEAGLISEAAREARPATNAASPRPVRQARPPNNPAYAPAIVQEADPYPAPTRAVGDTAREIAAPLHRRPAPRGLGQHAEAATMPFRAMPRDEAGGLRVPDAFMSDRHAGDARHGAAPRADPGTAGAAAQGEAAVPRLDPATRKERGYPPDWAFWHTGRGLGRTVGQAVDAAPPPRGAAGAHAAPLPDTRALVTARLDGSRIVVAAACPAARAAGIGGGMALTLARAMLPSLDVRDADPAGDAAALARLAIHAARRWSPVAAVDDGDGGAGLWLDMSVAPLFGGERAMCRRILRWLARRGYAARIAVAGTPGAAHALARHGGSGRAVLLCRPGAEMAALAALPPLALRLAPDTVATLARLGIADIGALAALPRAPLARRFGAALVHRLDEASGAVPEPIAAVVPHDVPQAERPLAEPIATADAIARVTGDLCAMLCARLLGEGLGARQVALVCRCVDGRDLVETIGTARATRDSAHLARLLCARIEHIDPGFGIERMRLIAFRAEPLAPEALTADPAAARSRDLAELVDIVAGRIGTRRLYRLGGRESDVPERSLVAFPPFGEPPRAHPRWPRPARMLDPPERLDGVTALLPDHPPRRFTWRGRRFDVAHGDGPERIHGEWWLTPSEEHGVRDYFQLEATGGERFWVYRRGDGVDPRTGDLSWHMQGLFG